jgi:hypothetical protein
MSYKRTAASIAKFKRTMAHKKRVNPDWKKHAIMAKKSLSILDAPKPVAPKPAFKKGPRELSLTKVGPGLYLLRML